MLITGIREWSALELARRAGIAGDVLVTRPVGERFLPELEAALLAVSDDEGLVLDFGSVTMMDASFADEVFGTLAARRGRRAVAPTCLALRNLEPSSFDNLKMALLSRPDREKDPGLRNCVLPVIDRDGCAVLIGKVEGHVQQTFDFLRARRCATARELADERDLDIAAASTRLKVAYDLGLAVRTEARDPQGKQFRYCCPW